MSTYKKINVLPYDSKWPLLFEAEEKCIREALGTSCIEVHHIGSTSVPKLSAKQDLDICLVIDRLANSVNLEKIGYVFKGEINILFRNFFSKNTLDSKVNLHVVERGHNFVNLNLCFRDYLRSHEDTRMAYQELKLTLAADPFNFERVEGRFPRYTLEKNKFIKETLKKAGYNACGAVHCTHFDEWETVKVFRQKYFFDNAPIADPHTWTFNHKDHAHIVYYKGVVLVGYAHIEFWPDQCAAMRIMVIDEPYRKQGFGGKLLNLCERWLKEKGCKRLHMESFAHAYNFYKKNGFIEMPFTPPEGYADPREIAMGKVL
ncbi:MAG: bifunctional GrpB family protein/GNAT family N-acetyltransferase [Candidatus Paracaedibacteraceae bacterium]|nr:bifunctional GrpB family protein/GNAT family N-acetyltransferase [Candidatus Paracaedibacteraceae bacterium]